MTIALVTLDMAGTTIAEEGTVYRILKSTVEEATGMQIPAAELAKWSGTSKHAAVRGLLEALGEDGTRADAVFDDFKASLQAAYAAEPPTLFPGVREAVAELRARGVKVALQTGYSRDVAEPLLQVVGWAVGDDVDALVTSDQVAHSRPAPDLILATMAATGIADPAQVLSAGDTANDLGAGTAAGVRYVVGVTTGAYTADDLARHPHTHILGSAAEIPGLLEAAGEFPQA
ncbi:phosphonatase-like hydrolase [Gryllotalpicola sp.]|uniref:phosphonatase-like hydrolase n=1 Tax=Gryllotalpicola sp. TaxID=1932787 RepID=UPI0026027AAF|nr:phosphonatase-like hydrolase [Gryllotalpicola sp.]